LRSQSKTYLYDGAGAAGDQQMNLKQFFQDKWPEILIFGMLSMLLYTVFFDVRDRLAKTETSNQDTKERLDRIAQALPDMNIRIAAEFKTLPIRTAMIVSAPLKLDAGWISQASIVDSFDGSVEVLQFPLKGPNDQAAFWLMLGATTVDEKKAVSVDEIQKYLSAGVSAEIFRNPNIQTDASFTFLKGSADLKQRLITVGAKEVKTTSFKPGVYQWDEFVRGVNDGTISLGWVEK
jgi:hypothetical protein